MYTLSYTIIHYNTLWVPAKDDKISLCKKGEPEALIPHYSCVFACELSCMCAHVCICVCICAFVCTCVHMCAFVCAFVFACELSTVFDFFQTCFLLLNFSLNKLNELTRLNDQLKCDVANKEREVVNLKKR